MCGWRSLFAGADPIFGVAFTKIVFVGLSDKAATGPAAKDAFACVFLGIKDDGFPFKCEHVRRNTGLLHYRSALGQITPQYGETTVRGIGIVEGPNDVVIDDFLDDAICASMVGEFPVFDPKAATNEFGLVGQKAVHDDVRALGGVFRQ